MIFLCSVLGCKIREGFYLKSVQVKGQYINTRIMP